MSEAYYRKWRPLDWKSVIGQDHVVRTLHNAILQERIAHAYLFSGPRGTGKTSTARIIAKAVNCLADDVTLRPCNECDHCQAVNSGRFLDLIEIDAASNTSVDDIRSLREKINFSPTHGAYKVYIIDEVHMLSNAAFNALLKTLEEPPSHAIFVLATTEVHKIPPTVLSRCQRHEFRRIPVNSIQIYLKDIAEKEGITVEPSALTEISRQATGSMRDAVSLLDQLASTGNAVTLEYTKEVLGTAGNEFVYNIIKAITENDAGSAISVINDALDHGSDPRQFGRQIVDMLRIILLIKMGSAESIDISKEEYNRLSDVAQNSDMPGLLSSIEIFDRASQSVSLGWQPSLQLELAVMKLNGTNSAFFNQQLEKSQKKPLQPKNSKLTAKQEEPQRKGEEKVKKADTAVSPAKQENAENKPNKAMAISDDIDVEQDGIQTHWDPIKEKAKIISAETSALLNSCKTVKISNGTIVLTFSSSILQSKMENGNNMENARKAIRAHTGKEFPIRCEVIGKESEGAKIDSAIEQDGMIGAALSLGGKMTKQNQSKRNNGDLDE